MDEHIKAVVREMLPEIVKAVQEGLAQAQLSKDVKVTKFIPDTTATDPEPKDG